MPLFVGANFVCYLHLGLVVTWHFEIQLTWNFFNSLSNLEIFFQLTSKFCDSLLGLGLNGKIVLSHSKRKQVHAIADTEYYYLVQHINYKQHEQSEQT